MQTIAITFDKHFLPYTYTTHMQFKVFKVPLLFLLLGLVWALTSDPTITYLHDKFSFEFLEAFRSCNDIVFVCIAAALLCFVINGEQKKAKETESQYRKLFEANPNPMWIYHVDTRKFIEVNDAAIEKYHYTRKEFLHMSIYDIRPVEDYEKLEEAIRIGESSMSDGFLWKHIIKGGEQITVSVTSHRLTFNNLPCSLVMITDVTEIVRSNEKLEQAFFKEQQLNEVLAENMRTIQAAHDESHRMDEVINKINNLVMLVNEQGYILWINHAFTTFTGYWLDEAIGKRPGEILFGEATSQETVASLIETISQRKFFSAEIINYKKNGEAYWTQLNISPIYDDNGVFEYFISVENIITERKEKENLLNTQYHIFKEIAWSYSHETRKPLASIIGLVELLDNIENEQERQECLDRIKECSVELDTIIRSNTLKIDTIGNSISPNHK